MNVAIFGRGAMGMYFAQHLIKGGNRVSFVSKRLSAELKNPVKCFTYVDYERQQEQFSYEQLNNPLSLDGEAFDLGLIAVKGYHTCDIASSLAALVENVRLKPSALVVSLQNGMGNLDILQSQFKTLNFSEGITYVGCTRPNVDTVQLNAPAETLLSDIETSNAESRKVLSQFASSIGATVTADYQKESWRKLLANSVLNPVTALTRQKNIVLTYPEVRETIVSIIEEFLQVAEHERVCLDFSREEAIDFVIQVGYRTGKNTSSMLADILEGRRTEIDSINGYLLRKATEHGLKLKINQYLYDLVKATEKK